MRSLLLVAFAALPFIAVPASAAHVSAELIESGATIKAGKPFIVALRLKVESEWHVYWKNPGDAGLPVSITWDLPKGFTAGPILWPHPYRYGKSPEVTYGFEGVVLLPVEITPPAGWDGSAVELRAKASWLVCREICVSESSDLKLMAPGVIPDGEMHEPVARTLSRIPMRPSGLTVSASWTGKEYLLRLVRTDRSVRLPDSAYFFPAEGEIIDHSAEQNVVLSGDTLVLHLPPSPYASGRPARLRGVLVSGDGREGPEPAIDLEIDATLSNDKK